MDEDRSDVHVMQLRGGRLVLRYGILLAVGYSSVEIDESYQAYNLTPAGQPTVTTIRYPGYPAEGVERQTASVTLQDEYRGISGLCQIASVRRYERTMEIKC